MEKSHQKLCTTKPLLIVLCKSEIYKTVENCEMTGSVLDKNKYNNLSLSQMHHGLH